MINVRHFRPWLWLLAQRAIGGTYSKQKLALQHYRGELRVLEIGCAVGNVSDAFRRFPNIEFTGIDIDRPAIEVARQRFRRLPNFRFSCQSLSELASEGHRFDYVLFAGILHHVTDADAGVLLRDALRVLASGGHLIISEPEALRPSDRWSFRAYHCLEKGQFLRSREHLERLARSTGAEILISEDHFIAPTIFSSPRVMRFNLICSAVTGLIDAKTGQLQTAQPVS